MWSSVAFIVCIIVAGFSLTGTGSVAPGEMSLMNNHCANHGGIRSIYANPLGMDMEVTCSDGEVSRLDDITITAKESL